jgi:hypothetical protein
LNDDTLSVLDNYVDDVDDVDDVDVDDVDS